MPRKVPSYRHYKPKNLGLVVIDVKQYYLGKYGTPESVAEYNRLIQEYLSPSPSSIQATAGQGELTVNELILAYWEHAKKHYRSPDGKPTGELDNFRDALRPLRKLYGHTLAHSFSPLALRTVREEMVKAGLCRTTVNARVNRIRRVFKWAVGMELLPVSIHQALQAVPGLQRGRTETRESAAVKPVPIEHVEAVLPALPRPVAAMVRLQLLTGCRTGEVIAMRGCDLVPGTPNWEYRPSSHKTAWRGHHRVIPLGPKAQEIVKEFLKPDPNMYLFSPRAEEVVSEPARQHGKKAKPSGGVPRRMTAGRPYLRRSYRQAIIRACRRAGVPEWSPLQLRHTAATMIRSRYGLEAAQTVLGHSKADVTQIYAERDLTLAHTVMAEIG
jgi:integrase